jgi:uncharacterized protein involved in exopolysaccharide biosynthesis
MINNPAINSQPDPTVSLGDLASDAWRAKWVVAVLLAIGTGVGAIAGLVLPKQYRAEILVSPVLDSPSGSVGGLASQYGDLASMAGLSSGGKGATNKAEAIATLQSGLITEAYIRDSDLLPVLYPKQWDAANKRWKSSDPEKIPTLWMANEYFKKKLRDVKEDRQTGLLTMKITWRNPVEAARWANELVRNTNSYLRAKAIRESEQNIQYLNEQASKTNVLEARSAIFSILKDEINKEMIAKGREEYALKIIDPAQVPERPSSTSALTLATAGFAAGALLGALYVLRKRLAL